MPPISPTTLLVAGSISITLSPAALVCTIRTVPARTVATARRHASATESLVLMEEHSKLSRHVADPLSPARPAGGRARPGVDARLRDVQDEDPAAVHGKAARPRTLLGVSCAQHGVPPAAAPARALRVHRGRVA